MKNKSIINLTGLKYASESEQRKKIQAWNTIQSGLNETIILEEATQERPLIKVKFTYENYAILAGYVT